MILNRHELQPTVGDVREMRERDGIGIAEARKILLRRNLRDTLNRLSAAPMTPTEAQLLAVLQAAFDGDIL